MCFIYFLSALVKAFTARAQLKRVNVQCNCVCAWYIEMSFAHALMSVQLVSHVLRLVFGVARQDVR